MILSLTQARAAELDMADVVVIGAGIAGLLAADRLVREGVRVVVLESGDGDDLGRAHPLNEVVQTGIYYRGAEEGRYRGLGGTSVRWGGAMLPFLPGDMAEHTAGWAIDWPVGFDELKPYFGELETMFRLPAGRYEVADPDEGAPFFVRSAKWPAFRKRYVPNVVDVDQPGLSIILGATVTGIEAAADGIAHRVVAATSTGETTSIETRFVVVAAGAIESTRLLLQVQRQRGRAGSPALGRYFFDHLSSPAAVIEDVDVRAISKAFGFRFQRGGMRDTRIEPALHFRREKALPAAFAHLAFLSDDEGGFAAVRQLFRRGQSREPLDWGLIKALAKDSPWLLNATIWRYVHKRLLAPADATFNLIEVIEQLPHPDSRITLDDSRRDIFGNPLANIHWDIREEDFSAFAALQRELLAWWSTSRFAGLGRIMPVDEADWRAELVHGGGIFHPGGSTRMAAREEYGVVDSNLACFGIPNLYILSTSAFPTGGGANPTFMLMAFSLRAAMRIAGQVRRGGL